MRDNRFFLQLTGFVALLCLLSIGSSCQSDETNAKSGKRMRIELQRAESEIRSELLRHTPIGMNADEVLKFARTRLKHVGHQPSYDKLNPVIKHFETPQKPPQAVGKRSIKVIAGRYGLNPLLRTEVWVKWAFDEHDALVDIIIEKSKEGL